MKSYSSVKILVAHLVLLTVCVAAGTVVCIKGYFEYILFLVPLIIYSVWKMIYTYSDTVRKITFMFNAIDCDDYTFEFTQHEKSVNINLLNASLNRIKQIMTNAKIRTIEREKYYELIENSVRTGILTINDRGNVFQVNRETMKLLGLSVLTHVNQLRAIDKSLTDILMNIKPGEYRHIPVRSERGEINLSVSASCMKYSGEDLKIISINDIDNALDEKEMESWIKLTRILTHEIMNSLAPITSLSDTLIDINKSIGKTTTVFPAVEGAYIKQSQLENNKKRDDITYGLETIKATSKSLISFVESYRKFTRLQTPVKVPFEIKPLLERSTSLICGDHIKYSLVVEPEDALVYADADLVNQAVVNILKNAVQVVELRPEGKIEIIVYMGINENIIVNISNNGGAIPEKIAEDIFLPFFTTKEQGSGIGLSVAKQIMFLHGGSLRLINNTDEQVTFQLIFK